MNKREKSLLECFRKLPESEAQTLLAFAEFLRERCAEPVPTELPAPTPVPRPEGESVVGALKRLSASYPMLDKGKMLNETSMLMAQHIMQGRDAGEVIEELELVFERHYRTLAGKEE